MQLAIGSRRLAAIAGLLGVVLACLIAPAHASPDTATTLRQSAMQGLNAKVLQQDLVLVEQAGGIGVVGAARGAKGQWRGDSGVRSIDAALRVNPSDEFRIGSITKTMIATLALQQVQGRHWSLHTRVGSVLPGLLPGHGDVTLEQLLSHRSGLPDYFAPLLAGVTTPDQLLAVLHRRYTDAQLVAAALTQPWVFPPGSDYSYSNTEYVVVGMMLQKATHHSIAQLLRTRIFGPARMHDSFFATRLPGFRGPHLSEYAIFQRPYNFDATNPSLFAPAGGVVSTAPDLDRFYRALFSGRLLPMDLVHNMATPRTLKPGDPAYGLGIYEVGDPCPGPKGQQQYLYGHDGATFGTLSTAFTSSDGTRQASVALTGRNYSSATQPTGTPANDFLIDAFTQTCPRPVPPAAKKAAAAQIQQALRHATAIPKLPPRSR